MSTQSPKIKKDEIRIALYVYLRRWEESLSKDISKIHWLSSTLQQLPIYPEDKRPLPHEFRTRDEVARRVHGRKVRSRGRGRVDHYSQTARLLRRLRPAQKALVSVVFL